MLIYQLDQINPNNCADKIDFIIQRMKQEILNLNVNGYINIGNNQNIVDSMLLEHLIVFLLKINNIEIKKHENGILVSFKNYNVLVENTPEHNSIKFFLQIDYLPNLYIEISNQDIIFEILGFSKSLDQFTNAELSQDIRLIIIELWYLILQMKQFSSDFLITIETLTNLLSKLKDNIHFNKDVYRMNHDHNIYKFTKFKHINHRYSFTLRESDYKLEISIYISETNNLIYRIQFADNNNNWCYLYIHSN